MRYIKPYNESYQKSERTIRNFFHSKSLAITDEELKMIKDCLDHLYVTVYRSNGSYGDKDPCLSRIDILLTNDSPRWLRQKSHGTKRLIEIHKYEDEWFTMTIKNGVSLSDPPYDPEKYNTNEFICDQIDGVLDCLSKELIPTT